MKSTSNDCIFREKKLIRFQYMNVLTYEDVFKQIDIGQNQCFKLKNDVYWLYENKTNKNNFKDPIESTRKFLYLLNTYSNVAGCKIIIKKQET